MNIDELTAEVQRLRGVLARIESLVWYEPDDDDDLVEAVRVMACERDEAKDRARRACQLLAKEIGADEHQMHFGIRLDSYKTIADSWRAKVAEVEAERDYERTVANEQLARAHDAVRERDEARAEVERLRNDLTRCREVQKATAEGWRHEVAEVAAIVGAPAHTAELAACVRTEVERMRAEVERLRAEAQD